jgi:hypothetical protein
MATTDVNTPELLVEKGVALLDEVIAVDALVSAYILKVIAYTTEAGEGAGGLATVWSELETARTNLQAGMALLQSASVDLDADDTLQGE